MARLQFLGFQAQTAYDTTAQGYALRIGMDQDAAKKLQTYANQYKLEGNTERSNTYAGQAALLMKQAENYRGECFFLNLSGLF